jgi:hypothetical protein
VRLDQKLVKLDQKLVNVCFEAKPIAVEVVTDKGKEFATTRLTTRQTYALAFIEGDLSACVVTFKEKDGTDLAATVVKMPDGEYVPFIFTVRGFRVKGGPFVWEVNKVNAKFVGIYCAFEPKCLGSSSSMASSTTRWSEINLTRF